MTTGGPREWLPQALARLIGGIRGLRRRSDGREHVVVIRIDGLGDAVLTLPFLEALRQRTPEARIDLIVSASAASLLRSCRFVDRTHGYRDPLPDGGQSNDGLFQKVRFLEAALDRSIPDRILLPRTGPDYWGAHQLARLTGSPCIIGPPLVTGLHEALAPLTLLGPPQPAVGSPVLDIDAAAQEQARSLLGAAAGPWLAVAAGAREEKRRWPAERFLSVSRRFVASFPNLRIVWLGAAADPGPPTDDALDLRGRTDPATLAAVLQKCSFTLANDSGPAHIAAAAGSRVAVISCHPRRGAPTSDNSPERFAPLGGRVEITQPESAADGCDVECRSRSAHCVLAVSEDAVHASLQRLAS